MDGIGADSIIADASPRGILATHLNPKNCDKPLQTPWNINNAHKVILAFFSFWNATNCRIQTIDLIFIALWLYALG